MAIAFDAVSSSTNWDGNTTFSHTVGAGNNRLLLVTIVLFDSRTVDYCRYDGVDMTLLSRRSAIGGGAYATTTYYMISPPVGTANITIAVNTTGLNSMSGAVSLNGVSSVTPLGTPVFEQTLGGVTSHSTDIVTTYTNSWIYELELALLNPSSDITQDSGQTVRVDQLGSNFNMTLDLATDETTTPGTYSQAFSLNPAVDYAMHYLVEVNDFDSINSNNNLMYY